MRRVIFSVDRAVQWCRRGLVYAGHAWRDCRAIRRLIAALALPILALGACAGPRPVTAAPPAAGPPTSFARVIVARPLAPVALRVPVLAALAGAVPQGAGQGEDVVVQTPDGHISACILHAPAPPPGARLRLLGDGQCTAGIVKPHPG